MADAPITNAEFRATLLEVLGPTGTTTKHEDDKRAEIKVLLEKILNTALKQIHTRIGEILAALKTGSKSEKEKKTESKLILPEGAKDKSSPVEKINASLDDKDAENTGKKIAESINDGM